MAKRPSPRRIARYGLWLGIPVLVMIAIVMLPRFLELETYRPRITTELESMLNHRVTLGSLEARLVPPEIIAENIVLLERSSPHRPVLAAGRVQLRFRLISLRRRELRLETVSLNRCLVLIQTNRLSPIAQRLVSRRHLNLAVDDVVAKFDEGQEPVITGRPSFLGRAARFTVILDRASKRPIRGVLKSARVDELLDMSGPRKAAWKEATLDAHFEVRDPRSRGLLLIVDRLTLPPVAPGFLRGSFVILPRAIRGRCQFERLSSPMVAQGQVQFGNEETKGSITVDRYSPELTKEFLRNRWIDRLGGSGSIEMTWSNKGLLVKGSDFQFTNSRLHLPSWSASQDRAGLSVTALAHIPETDGRADIQWTQNRREPYSLLQVEAASVTVRDLYDVLNSQPSSPSFADSWQAVTAHYEGLIDQNGSLEIKKVYLNFKDFTVQARGQIVLDSAPAQIHVSGSLSELQLVSTLQRLGMHPAPITGIAHIQFDLLCPWEPQWQEHLSGNITYKSGDGFIRAGKTIYEIAGLLNLTDILKRSQKNKSTGLGIPYESAVMSAVLSDGILSVGDFMIRTENMNVAGRGRVNIPTRQMDVNLDLLFMNTMRERLSAVPLVKRIVTPGSGLIKIPVKLRGPIDHPRIE